MCTTLENGRSPCQGGVIRITWGRAGGPGVVTLLAVTTPEQLRNQADDLREVARTIRQHAAALDDERLARTVDVGDEVGARAFHLDAEVGAAGLPPEMVGDRAKVVILEPGSSYEF